MYPRVLPPELCRHLINRFDNEPRRAIRQKYGTASGYPEHRRCPVFEITGPPEWVAEDLVLGRLLGAVGLHYFTEELGMPSVNFFSTGYEVGCYRPPDDHCGLHYDGAPAHPGYFRLMSAVTYLNTVTEGAATVFPRQAVSVQPEEGAVLIFPPHFTHPHHVPPPVRHPRYFVVTWFVTEAWPQRR